MTSIRCLCLLLAMCLPNHSMSLALESVRAEDNYETFPSVNGSRYKLYTLHVNWGEALTLCQGDAGGSHLVIINSQEEADVVKTLFARITNSAVNYLAVGINDIVTEGTWVTIQGELVSMSGYNKWMSGQPAGGTAENCGVVTKASLYGDLPCSNLAPFICEKPVA